MTDQDYEAVLDLASEMLPIEATKFIRSEIGCSLLEAKDHMKSAARRRPTSVLGTSLVKYRV